MKQYMIHCCVGVGGLFLTSVLAKMLGIPMTVKLSDTGNCHDMGRGVWRGSDGVVLVGDQWDLNYRPGQQLYYTHVMPDNFQIENPDIKIVFVSVRPEDYRMVAKLWVKKAWPDIWTQDEYNKWHSPNYPPYSKNNIQDSDLICQDLIADLLETNISPWMQRNGLQTYDYQIDFRTIMGLDGRQVDQEVAQILNKETSQEISQYVTEYQRLNHCLYFTES